MSVAEDKTAHYHVPDGLHDHQEHDNVHERLHEDGAPSDLRA